MATPKVTPAASEPTPRVVPRSEVLIAKTWSQFVAGTNLLVGSDGVQTFRPDGYIRAETMPFGNRPAQPGVLSPAGDVVDLLGDWPNDAWLALQGSGLVEVFHRVGPEWFGAGATSGECDPGIEADTCGPYIGIGRWTGGRVIYPLIRPRGKRTGPPGAQVVIEPIQWEFEFPPMFFVAADASDKGLPKLTIEPGFFPRVFRSDPSGHAILVGSSAPRDMGLTILRWRPASLEPATLHLDHLLFEADHDDALVVVGPDDHYLLAMRRAPAPVHPPADGEQPARHDAMVLVHLQADHRDEVVIEADSGSHLRRSPDGTLWILAGRGADTSLVRIRPGQPAEFLALPGVLVDGRVEPLEVEDLYAASDTVVDVIAHWGTPSARAGVVRIDFGAPAGAGAAK